MKEEIVKAAKDLFLKYGIKSVSIDDVCNALHISKKTFYVYFKQKDEVVETILEEMRAHNKHFVFSQGECVIDQMLRHSKIKKGNDEMVRKHLNFFYDLEKFYPEIYSRHCAIERKKGEDHIRALIVLGQEQGVFRTDIDEDVMSKFFSLMFGSILLQLKELTAKTPSHLGGFVVDVCLRYLLNAEGTVYYLNKIEKREN